MTLLLLFIYYTEKCFNVNKTRIIWSKRIPSILVTLTITQEISSRLFTESVRGIQEFEWFVRSNHNAKTVSKGNYWKSSGRWCVFGRPVQLSTACLLLVVFWTFLRYSRLCGPKIDNLHVSVTNSATSGEDTIVNFPNEDGHMSIETRVEKWFPVWI